jgi:hypothetical protein
MPKFPSHRSLLAALVPMLLVGAGSTAARAQSAPEAAPPGLQDPNDAGEAADDEVAPDEAAPSEAPPVQADPAEAPPAEAPPVEAAPVEAVPVQPPPIEAPPAEAPPVGAPPVEAPPVEAPPSEAAPVQPPAPQPTGQPPAPAVKAPPVQAQPAQANATGQWVYTQQYGWLWLPHGDQYVYTPTITTGTVYPSEYVYRPAYGWTWLAAPWVWERGPRLYFGVGGLRHHGWLHGRGYVGHGVIGGFHGGIRGSFRSSFGRHSSARRFVGGHGRHR